MLRSCLALLCAAACFCSLPRPVFAQLGPYNPYAKPMDDTPPVAADGTLHWPVFYRSAKMELKYENLHNLGACLGTNKSVTVPVEKNKLNIDTLPEVSVSGRVVQVGKSSVLLQQADGKIDMIVTHPAGVSRVDVTGDVPAAWLKSGMLVRFLGQVDSHGHGAEPLDAIDVMSAPGDFAPPEVEPGHRQNITAVVKSLHGKTLVVTTLNGSLRKLTFTLTSDAIAHLMTKELGFTSLGDELTAKGHLYTVAGAKPDRCVFASDVIVSKQAMPTAPAEEVQPAAISNL